MLDNRIFVRATLAVVLCSAFPMIVVGCYFVHIPWNMERLGIGERDLGYAILVFGIFFLDSIDNSAAIVINCF
jgi:hypothetical protein